MVPTHGYTTTNVSANERHLKEECLSRSPGELFRSWFSPPHMEHTHTRKEAAYQAFRHPRTRPYKKPRRSVCLSLPCPTNSSLCSLQTMIRGCLSPLALPVLLSSEKHTHTHTHIPLNYFPLHFAQAQQAPARNVSKLPFVASSPSLPPPYDTRDSQTSNYTYTMKYVACMRAYIPVKSKRATAVHCRHTSQPSKLEVRVRRCLP